MDWAPHETGGLSGGRRSLSRVSTATSTTLAAYTPPVSDTDSASASTNNARLPMPTLGPLLVSSLSVTHWRPKYPRIGQFAMTPSEEVVAATPDGLVYFRRVPDHRSKPWSESRPFHATTARLNASSVTGLALHQGANEEKGELNVYCVAAGRLHAFFRSKDSASTFAVDPRPPFAGFRVSGTPAVASIKERFDYRGFCVIVPCPSGGILYTADLCSTNFHSYDRPSWELPIRLAKHLGIVSAVSVASETASKPGNTGTYSGYTTDIAAVCIAKARLYSIDGVFERPSRYSNESTWKDPKYIRIQHPGEVTGNPVLITHQNQDVMGYQLDLLVPSAEGGVFHFIRTATTPDEWHMIGRINFPTGIPIASSLAFWRDNQGQNYHHPKHRAFVQCGGRLYLIQTPVGARPWVGSQLHPVSGPGPFLH